MQFEYPDETMTREYAFIDVPLEYKSYDYADFVLNDQSTHQANDQYIMNGNFEIGGAVQLTSELSLKNAWTNLGGKH